MPTFFTALPSSTEPARANSRTTLTFEYVQLNTENQKFSHVHIWYA